MNQELINTIKNSNKILILTHIYPDIDAVCSGLIAINFLKQITDAELVFNIEGNIDSKLNNFYKETDINNKKTLDIIKEFDPSLILLVDTNSVNNISYSDAEEISNLIKNTEVKLAIIDNHPEIQKTDSDFYINNGLSASAEELFDFFAKNSEIVCDKETSDLIMRAILADTNRFLYKTDNYEVTFANVCKLMKNGSQIETVWNTVYHFSLGELKSMSLFMMNFKTNDKYNYSYITDEQVKELKKEGLSWEDLSNGYYMFVDLFLRYIGSAKWGFAILPEYDVENKYRVSLRSIDDSFDTSVIARKFNGGGHRSASGCSVIADGYMDAVGKIEECIE